MLLSFFFGRTSPLRSGAKAAAVAFSCSPAPGANAPSANAPFVAERLSRFKAAARGLLVAGALALSLGVCASNAQAQVRVGGAVRPDAGFIANTLARNDDGSTVAVPLGFNANFFGTTYTSVFVNNNGDITFDAAYSSFTPDDLNTIQRVLVAGFFTDIDTRGTTNNSQPVRYGQGTVDGRRAFAASFINVGYFSQSTNKLNSFQIVLIDRSDTGAGNFDIELNYDKVQFDAGSTNNGVNGIGTPQNLGPGKDGSARVGFSNGTQRPGTFFEFPGSGTARSFLDTNLGSGLIYNSFNSSVAGRYVFEVRGGTVGGRFSINDASVVEGNPGDHNVATFTVTLTPPAAIESTIDYTTGNGTAVAPDDYALTSGTLTFAPGESTKTITVPIVGDLLREGDETFTLNLSNAVGGGITRPQGTGTIFDEEANTPPIASDFARSVNEDSVLSLSRGSFAAAYSDAENDPLNKVKIVALPTNGALKLRQNAVTLNQVILADDLATLTYTPNPNYFGADTVGYQDNDRIAYSNTANLNITVNSVNDPPTITSLSNVRINRNTSTAPLAFTIGDVETAPDALVVSATSDNPSVAPVSSIVFGGSGTDRTVTVTPLAGQVGIANITVSVSDGEATTSTSFVLTVNGAPVLADSSFTVPVGRTFFSQLAASDPNNDALTYAIVTPALPNGLRLSTAGLISGTPTQVGSFSAVVRVSDGADQTTARVSFTVTAAPVNHPPVVDNQTLSVSLNRPFSLPLSGSDPDGDTLTYVVASNSTMPPQITVSPRGVLSGVPTQAGQFNFSLTVSDGRGGVVRANYLLIVTGGAPVSGGGTDGQGPVITRNSVPQRLSRAQLGALTLAGTVRDTAPNGVTPSGLNRMLYQLRRSSDGYAFDGSAFTPDVNQGYVAIPVSPTSDGSTVNWSQSLSVLPGDTVMTPGRYSVSILAQDNAGNYGITVVYFTITASSTVARTSPSAGRS